MLFWLIFCCLLPPALLYVWLAVLQLFDAWITHQGLSRGGRLS